MSREDPATRFAKDQLKALIERIERLEEEKKAIADDIKDVYAEAKANGFDTKAMRTIVKLRKQDVDERKEQEAILDTYLAALGMLLDDEEETAPAAKVAAVVPPHSAPAARSDAVRRSAPIHDQISSASSAPRAPPGLARGEAGDPRPRPARPNLPHGRGGAALHKERPP